MNWDSGNVQHMADTLQRQVDADISVRHPLKGLNSWKVGGCSDLLVRPRCLAAAQQLLAFLTAHKWPWVVLGSGTNVLIPDAGYLGVVVQLSQLKEIKMLAPGHYHVESGVSLRELVRMCAEHGNSGIEDLAAIPGSVGGAVVMNAGAGEHTFGAVVTGVHAVLHGQSMYRAGAELKFGYRSSAVGAEMCILAVEIQLHASDQDACVARCKRALEYRKKVQQVCLPSAGSVFRNPPGICAWKIIDSCALRGFKVGGAQVSPQHANFIVNTGNATAADVAELIAHVQREVFSKTGVVLETEIRFLNLRQDQRS
ncbi:MAG: UDP-N-acetylmuramate dehydrogenase [Desulfuromonadaceae bacterium]|nr:UDP-N-acetylmuramate dehydrogenase [Desulfuromonadaceae bacterium]